MIVPEHSFSKYSISFIFGPTPHQRLHFRTLSLSSRLQLSMSDFVLQKRSSGTRPGVRAEGLTASLPNQVRFPQQTLTTPSPGLQGKISLKISMAIHTTE